MRGAWPSTEPKPAGAKLLGSVPAESIHHENSHPVAGMAFLAVISCVFGKNLTLAQDLFFLAPSFFFPFCFRKKCFWKDRVIVYNLLEEILIFRQQNLPVYF
jgi:hypothetical protein